MHGVSIEHSGAFVDVFSLPPVSEGPLAGLTFAVKDLIDIAGRRTGCGNPTWLETHSPAAHSAVCVDQLLAAGASCAGKTVTDEVAFSLLGENHFYGTPLNPAAPDRVPGGSSSGSASAVACRLVDFAIGTDTGGSIRVPASNCGLWGLRPTHGIVSVAGVMPFSPSFDTVGILARSLDVLRRTASVLLGLSSPAVADLGAIHLVKEGFAVVEVDVRSSLSASIAALPGSFAGRVVETSLAELCDDERAGELDDWRETFAILRLAEVASCLGAWVESTKPRLGPATAEAFELVRSLDRRLVDQAMRRREELFEKLRRALSPHDLLCIPTVNAVPPRRGELPDRRGPYYRGLLGLTSIAGVGRMPQLSMPLANVDGVPVGLSLLAAPYGEASLLSMAEQWLVVES